MQHSHGPDTAAGDDFAAAAEWLRHTVPDGTPVRAVPVGDDPYATLSGVPMQVGAVFVLWHPPLPGDGALGFDTDAYVELAGCCDVCGTCTPTGVRYQPGMTSPLHRCTGCTPVRAEPVVTVTRDGRRHRTRWWNTLTGWFRT